MKQLNVKQSVNKACSLIKYRNRKGMVSVVPKDAVIKVVDKSYIFVLEGTEKKAVERDADDKNDSIVNYRVKMMEVVPGIEELGYVQISLLEPLQQNVKIVTKGAFYSYCHRVGQ